MELPHDSILSYLKKNHVFTLCATAGDDLWCASCFYIADPEAMMLYFLTEPHTRHCTLMQQNPRVAGTISAQTVTVAKIRGIQFQGEIVTLSEEEEKQAWHVTAAVFRWPSPQKPRCGGCGWMRLRW